jgi:hypothetical protein
MVKVENLESLSIEDRGHLAKADLIHKLSPYYESHENSIVSKISILPNHSAFFHS